MRVYEDEFNIVDWSKFQWQFVKEIRAGQIYHPPIRIYPWQEREQ